LQSTEQIPAELTKQEVLNYFLRSSNLLNLFVIRKNCHSSGSYILLYLFVERVIKLTSNYRRMSL